MLEAKWASPMSKGKQRWTKIRNVIIGVAQFRRTIRRRSLSLYSNSGSEFDRISHASVDSYLDDNVDKTSVDAVGGVSSSKVVFSPERSVAGTGQTGSGTAGGSEEGGTLTSTTTVLDDRLSTGFFSRLCFSFGSVLVLAVSWLCGSLWVLSHPKRSPSLNTRVLCKWGGAYVLNAVLEQNCVLLLTPISFDP